MPYLTVQGREPAPLGHFLEPLLHLSLWAGLAQFSMPQEAPDAPGSMAWWPPRPVMKGSLVSSEPPTRASAAWLGFPHSEALLDGLVSPQTGLGGQGWGAPQSRVFRSRTIPFRPQAPYPPRNIHPLLGAGTSSDGGRCWDPARKAGGRQQGESWSQRGH